MMLPVRRLFIGRDRTGDRWCIVAGLIAAAERLHEAHRGIDLLRIEGGDALLGAEQLL